MTTANRPTLETVGLTAGYRRRRHPAVTVLSEVNLAARPGELITLIGPNGAGKSTLLRTLVGAQPPLGGQVLLDGADLASLSPRQRARRLAITLTEPVEVGLMSVEAVVGLGRLPYRSWLGRARAEDRDAVDRALLDTGVEGLRRRPLSALSDGERQRVMVARALAQEPAVLVLDEPTAFLDVARRIELAAMLNRLTVTTGATIVLSTHDLGFALRRADQVWLVDPEGTVTAKAPEDLAFDGTVARVFAGANMTFDDAAATIVVADQGVPSATVRVAAEGRLRLWAEHAVRRAGWEPASDTRVDPVLRVEPGTPCRWRLESCAAPGPGRAAGTGFASLVTHLRRHPRAGGEPTLSPAPPSEESGEPHR